MRRRYSAAGGVLEHLNEANFFKDVPKERKCMKCNTKFTSHQGRRLCTVCNAQNNNTMVWEVAADAKNAYR